MPGVKVALSAREFAASVGVSTRMIYDLIHAGQITAKRAGTKYLIPATELDRWFASLPDAGDAA